MENGERIAPLRRHIPIFGGHLIGDEGVKAYTEFVRKLESSVHIPEIYSWPQATIRQTRNQRPSMISVDGDSFSYPDDSPTFHAGFDPESWFGYPGNIFDLKPKGKDLFIVHGDVSNPPLVRVRSYTGDKSEEEIIEQRKEDSARTIAEQSYVYYYTQIRGLSFLDDPNQAVYTENERRMYQGLLQRKRELFELFMKEKIASKGVTFGSLWALSRAIRSGASMTRRSKFIHGIPLALGFLNDIRISEGVALTQDPLRYEKVKPLHPVSFFFQKDLPSLDPLKYIDEDDKHWVLLRNALVAIKMDDVEQMLSSHELSNGPKVAVWGSAHDVEDMWNNRAKQEQILLENFQRMFEVIQNSDITKYSYMHDPKNPADHERVVRQMSEFFGGTAVWRVRERPPRLSKDLVKEQILPEVAFISPSITRIVQQAAQNSGYT